MGFWGRGAALAGLLAAGQVWADVPRGAHCPGPDCSADELNRQELNRILEAAKGPQAGVVDPATGLPVPPKVPETAPDKPATFDGAKDLDRDAERLSKDSADDAFRKSDRAGKIAKYERGLADNLATSYDNIKSYTAPRQASSNPDRQDEAAARLAQSVVPPPEFAEAYKGLGLSTNQDVFNNAPTYVQNLADDANRNADKEDRLRDSGDQGLKAARTLGGFRDTVSRRASNMNSTGSARAAAADSGAAVVNQAAGSGRSAFAPGSGGADHNGSSSLSRSATVAASTAPGPAGSGSSSGQDSESPLATRSARNGNALRDSLQRDLASTGAAGAASSESVPGKKSAFSGFFQEGAGTAVPAVAAPEADSASTKPFTMSGADTEKAVAGMLGNAASDASDAELGSPDVSIFVRMKKFLTRCQAEKRISSQK